MGFAALNPSYNRFNLIGSKSRKRKRRYQIKEHTAYKRLAGTPAAGFFPFPSMTLDN
jgi:hypothetical protein